MREPAFGSLFHMHKERELVWHPMWVPCQRCEKPLWPVNSPLCDKCIAEIAEEPEAEEDICPLCGKRFRTKKAMANHRNRVHQEAL